MKRTRPLLMTLSILTGLVVGFGGRGALTPPINRPAEMVALFETYCLPLKTGNAVVLPEGRRFEWARLLPGEQRWIDHVSLTHIIVRDPRSCTVSDRPKWLTKAEQDELERLVADMVAEHLPELSSDPKAELANWDLSRAWLAGRPWIDRWGVQLSSSGSDGGDHTTTLRFVAPPKSKV